MVKRGWWLGAVCLAALSGVALAADFVGTTACAACHAESHQAWLGSHHDQAMQHAGPDTVLGDFEDASFTYAATTSTFFRRDGNYFVRTDGPDGQLRDYPIQFTFGVVPLQQYLVPLTDGRLQALSIAWDSRAAEQGGQRWFHLYPGENVDHRDELHWTGLQQNWNFMCAGCHSTDLEKRFDAKTGAFDTAWREIDVGCEACHGPGSGHVDWAAQAPGTRSRDDNGFGDFDLDRHVDWPIDPATGSAVPRRPGGSVQIEVCADCHSRRGEIAPGSATSPRLLDHFMPAFLTEGLYHPDGQMDDEVFEWGSFAQSRMHQAGVVCSNCHDPHSLELRAPGDAVCGQCHLTERFATRAHHHHEPGGAGSSCLDCHMPATTYMVVDPRRDHSLKVPRPDLTVTLGTPNACNACHRVQTPEWAVQHFVEWYPDRARRPHPWAEAFASARQGDPRAESTLQALVTDAALPPIVRGTAMLELAPLLTPASASTLRAAVNDASPLVRIAGLRALDVLNPQERFEIGGALADDPLLAVRAEAGSALAAVPRQNLAQSDRTRLERAVADAITTQQHNADRPEAQTNLGTLFANQSDWPRAEAAYRNAIDIDGRYVPAYVNLADLLRVTGRDPEAAALLERGLERRPQSADLHHALGLQQVRAGAAAAAVSSLGTAARLAPGSPRFAYVYAIALNSTAQRDQALEVLSRALERYPYDHDMLLALVTINIEAGSVEAARQALSRLLEIRPDDPQALELARFLDPRR